jgi:hypothetical protein
MTSLPDPGRAPAARGAAAAVRLETAPFRVLGALLLLGALDPPRWPASPSPQWAIGVLAACAGLWAGAPIVDRPVLYRHNWASRINRHRNTLLAAAAVFLAAFQSPPVWLMAVEVLLLPAYLAAVDTGAAAPRPSGGQLAQALWAAGGSALVLLAAAAPVTGGAWGRFVAGLCVFGALGLLWTALRLRRPARWPQTRP